MKCPECGKRLQLPDHARRNMETYGGMCKVKTECCGEIVHAWPIITFGSDKIEPKPSKDDWGNS